MSRRVGLVLCALLLSSCGHFRGGSKGLLDTKGEGGLLNAGATPANEPPLTDAVVAPNLEGFKLKNTNFDLPVVYNDEVKNWVGYFTGPGRKHFQVYLERKARMEPVILPKLKEAGLPQDLIYLAMIESGFSTQAASHAGAVGPWQFIRGTGRLYGLKTDWWLDERRDPMKATGAAVAYLSRLHAEFGDWALACAAYNSGEQKIRNAISRLNTRDFWTIARNRRALRRETKDYVPKMLAAAIIGKNPEQFGFKTYPVDPSLTQFSEVRIPRAENLRTIAKVAGVDRDTIALLNPELLRCCTPPQRGSYTVRVPQGQSAQLVSTAIENGEIGRFANFQRHVIRRGDTLSRIAASAGVPTEAILSMNDVRSVRALKPGMELVIPDRGRSVVARNSGRVIASAESAPVRFEEPKNSSSITHVVKRGDTLYGISRLYAVRIEEIRRWNSLRRSKNLRPGSRIKLYVRNERS
ncbi:MAG: LysM peptidoglycan-binding domain-containing protein [Bdellovibrionota bacterium]